MTIQTEWTLRRHAVENTDDFNMVVKAVFYTVFAFDDTSPTGRRGRYDGYIEVLPPPSLPDAETAESYDKLLEDYTAVVSVFKTPAQAGHSDLIEWAKASLGESGVRSVEDRAIKNLGIAVNPPVVSF